MLSGQNPDFVCEAFRDAQKLQCLPTKDFATLTLSYDALLPDWLLVWSYELQ
jgi:hypothetical protein